MDIVPVRVRPDRKSVFFEHVDRSVDVPGNIHDQVIPAKAHEVLTDIAEVIDGTVFSLVLVDGRKAHAHGPAALHGGLVDHGDVNIIFFGPVGAFHACPGTSHPRTDNQKIGGYLDGLEFLHSHHPP